MKNPVCMFALAAVLCGCGSNLKNDVFMVDPEKAIDVNLTDVATDIRIIRLKSGEPLDNGMYYRFYDNWILGYAPNSGGIGASRLYLFDNTGNLVSTLERVGRGPGEYIGISKIACLDETNDILHVWVNYSDGMGVLKYHIPDMTFAGVSELGQDIHIDDIGELGNGRVLALVHYPYESYYSFTGQARTVLYDINHIKDSVVLHTTNWAYHNNAFEDFASNTNKDNPIITLMGYIGSVCRIEGDSLRTVLRFTFADKGVPKKLFDEADSKGMDEDVSDIAEELLAYALWGPNDCCLPYVWNAAQNGNITSFSYTYLQNHGNTFTRLYYLNDGKKGVSYRGLTVPGLNLDCRFNSMNSTSMVGEITNSQDLIDNSAAMSDLGRAIVDSLKLQNDDNPILLQFRFNAIKSE